MPRRNEPRQRIESELDRGVRLSREALNRMRRLRREHTNRLFSTITDGEAAVDALQEDPGDAIQARINQVQSHQYRWESSRYYGAGISDWTSTGSSTGLMLVQYAKSEVDAFIKLIRGMPQSYDQHIIAVEFGKYLIGKTAEDVHFDLQEFINKCTQPDEKPSV